MSKKHDILYFGHMYDTARKIVAKCQGLTRERFEADENLRLALLHVVQTIGEAARRLSEKGREAHPEIPWREMTGIRHKIVHDYMDIDEEVLWQVVVRDIPLLTDALAARSCLRTRPSEVSSSMLWTWARSARIPFGRWRCTR